MSYVNELLSVGKQLEIDVDELSKDESKKIISEAIKKFNPYKTSGHLAIDIENSISLPIDMYEFKYSQYLPKGKGYVFFDQNHEDKERVFVIKDIRKICSIMEESFGMEYFVVDEKMDYLIASNWYVIEVLGIEEGCFRREL